MNNRELKIISKVIHGVDGMPEHTMNYAEFNSNGRRVKRLITPKETEKLRELISAGSEEEIDSFCYRIA